MSRRHAWMLMICGLILAPAVRADATADLQATLSRLKSTQPLAASLRVDSTVHDGDAATKTTHATLQVNVASGPDGLHLGFSPALLQRSAQEAAVNAKNDDAPTPIADLLGKITPVRVQSMVDYAPVLQRYLEAAVFVSQSDEAHDGKPSHLLLFKVPLPASASKAMTIKDYTGQIKVWLGADFVPVAMQNRVDVKGRKFLISVDFSNTTTNTFRVIDSRLVVVSQRVEESHSVFGHGSRSVTDAVLTPVTAAEPKSAS